MLTLSPDDNQLSVYMSDSISVLYCSDTHIFVIFIYSDKVLNLFFFLTLAVNCEVSEVKILILTFFF